MLSILPHAGDDLGDAFGFRSNGAESGCAFRVRFKQAAQTDGKRRREVDDGGNGLLQFMGNHARKLRNRPDTLDLAQLFLQLTDGLRVGVTLRKRVRKLLCSPSDEHMHTQFIEEEDHHQRSSEEERPFVPLNHCVN